MNSFSSILSTSRIDPGSLPQLAKADFNDIPSRRISKRTCQLYDYTSTATNHYANYKDEHGLNVCQHVRTVETKGFRWIGRQKGLKPQLFGQHLGSRGDLVICEGELDAMSVHECFGFRERSKIISVSVPDGAQSAANSIKPHLEWVLGFDRVTILFDNDEPGIKAAAQVAELIGPKARIASGLGYKDANEAWVADDSGAIKRAIVQAGRHRPTGIVNATELMDAVLNPTISRGHDLPWAGWNDHTDGLKPGELWLISGGTGIGKSLFTRSMALSLCQRGVRVAYLGYEESVATTFERMISEAIRKPFHLMSQAERHEVEQEMREATKVFAPNLFLIDKFGSDDFDQFVANVKHYVLNEECSVVVLDHFSLLADGIALNVDQRRAIDKAIKDLKTLAMELDFTFIVVCHLSRSSGGFTSHEEGGEPSLAELRGSHSLAQIPDYIWMLQRNPRAEDEAEANITKCWLKKNRVKGEVGHFASLQFIPRTCTFVELNTR